MARYLAVIHQDDGSDFGVSFLDFPGCISAGRTLDIALRNAGEALAFHIEGMEEDGAEIPQGTLPGKAMLAASDESPDGLVGFHWVHPARAEPDRAVRLNITLPQSLVDEIEATVGERGRSSFLAESARAALAIEEAATDAESLKETVAEIVEEITEEVKKKGRRLGMRTAAGRKHAG